MKSVIPQFSYPTNEDVKKLLFSHEICEKLKYYVYAYYDPADMSFPFYIGKGKGNRCFQHLLDKSDSRKVSKIREIYDRGQKPVIEIVRFNLENEREALVAESVAIDLLGKELTNIKKGFQSRLFGRRSLDEIRRDLGSDDTIYINDTLPNEGIYQCKEDNYVYYVKESKEKCGFYFCGEIYEIGYTYNSLIEEFFPGGIYMYRESGVVGIPSELKIAVIANSEEELVNNYTETFYNLLKKLSEEYKENVQFIIFFNSSLENINTTFDKLFLMVGYNTNNVTQAFGLGRKYGDYIFYDGDPEDLLNIIFSNRKNYSEDAREAVKFNRNINMIITKGKNITLEEFTELFKNSFDEVY